MNITNKNNDYISYFAQCYIVPAKGHRISTAELNEKFEEFCAINGFEDFNRICWYDILSQYYDIKRVRGISYGECYDCRGIEGVDFCSYMKNDLMTDGMLWLTDKYAKDFFTAFFVLQVLPQVRIKIYTKNELQMAFDRFCLSRKICPFYVHDWDEYHYGFDIPECLSEGELSLELDKHRSLHFGINSLSVTPEIVKKSFDEGRIVSVHF